MQTQHPTATYTTQHGTIRVTMQSPDKIDVHTPDDFRIGSIPVNFNVTLNRTETGWSFRTQYSYLRRTDWIQKRLRDSFPPRGTADKIYLLAQQYAAIFASTHEGAPRAAELANRRREYQRLQTEICQLAAKLDTLRDELAAKGREIDALETHGA